jgi:hypothetical protein
MAKVKNRRISCGPIATPKVPPWDLTGFSRPFVSLKMRAGNKKLSQA